jgi:hypothetical protein
VKFSIRVNVVLTWIIVWLLERNSTNRGTTPHSITRSIGGFFSFDSNLQSVSRSTYSEHCLHPCSLSELHGRIQLHLLVVAVHILQHFWQGVIER